MIGFYEPPKYGRNSDDIPKASVWSVENPGEPIKYFIIWSPQIWGPFFEVEELHQEYRELREAGMI